MNMSQTTEPLVHYLEQLQASGQSYVALSSEAREMLRKWFIASKKNQKIQITQGEEIAPPTPKLTEQNESPINEQQPPVALNEPSEAYHTPPVSLEAHSSPLAPAHTSPQVPATSDSKPTSIPTVGWDDISKLEYSGETKEEKIADLKAQAEKWTKGRAQLNNQLFFSKGNVNADIMFVWEAPGEDEEKAGELFTGAAGEKMTAIIKAMGIPPAEVYHSYLVKYRPKVDPSDTNLQNRAPNLGEIQSFLGFLQAEIEVVQPKIIVGLGTSVARGLLKEENLMITSARGMKHDVQGTLTIVTYHPSFLLKNEQDQVRKRKVWEDMIMAMESLELPITGKQRGYFLPKA